jgi:hypothetical protein
MAGRLPALSLETKMGLFYQIGFDGRPYSTDCPLGQKAVMHLYLIAQNR